MKNQAVILNLRVARASDFSDASGQKKYGCLYFQQSIKGTFCNQPYYFNENTDMEVFKELYQCRQIWVLAGIFDEVTIIERKNKRYLNEIKTDPKSRPCTCKKRK